MCSVKLKKHFGLKFTSFKPKFKFGLDLGDNVSKSVKFIVNHDLQDTFLKHPAIIPSEMQQII